MKLFIPGWCSETVLQELIIFVFVLICFLNSKLLHVVQELEREQQRHLDLQLAYDNRTREWRYQQEQLVHLLQEANPLRSE